MIEHLLPLAPYPSGHECCLCVIAPKLVVFLRVVSRIDFALQIYEMGNVNVI